VLQQAERIQQEAQNALSSSSKLKSKHRPKAAAKLPGGYLVRLTSSLPRRSLA